VSAEVRVSADPPQRPLSALALGVALTLGQVLLALLARWCPPTWSGPHPATREPAPLPAQPTLAETYRSLAHFDGEWYRRVVEKGYTAPTDLTNNDELALAFFPGYPLTARLVGRLGVEADVALLLTAQAACVGFWAYLLLLCRSWGVPPALTAWAVALIAAHPAAFFLVAAYSEALFLGALFGFVYWSERPGVAAALLAGAHGAVMTATRLVGVPLAVYPLVRALFREGPLFRRCLRPALLAVAAALGAGGYFLYQRVAFGSWGLYGQVEQRGWNVQPDFLAAFSWRLFAPGWPPTWWERLGPDQLSRLSAPLLALALLAALAAEAWLAWRGRGAGWRERAGLYFLAVLLFYVPVCGHMSRGLVSMLRFGLCVWVPLVLAATRLLAAQGLERLPRPARLTLLVLVVLSGGLQFQRVWMFTHWFWVA
jgi:hypothetical protein